VLVEAVVADLDGTLVRPDFSVSAATLEALESVRAAGIPVVIATARNPHGLEHVAPIAARTDVAGCCSGAIGWSTVQKTVLWQEMLDPGLVGRVVAMAVGHRAGVASFDGNLWRMTEAYDRLSPGLPRGPTRVIVEPTDLARMPSSTMAVTHSADQLALLLEDLLKTDPGTGALSRAGETTILDVTAPGVDKGTGARRALARLGIEPAAAVGFGDMSNDLSLLRMVGRSYAVGDSDAAVARAAHEVVPGVEADGFAKKIADLKAAGWLLV
jgi:Cof subfamily protein (haloacid dehalogenase superfamily)